MQTKYVIQSYGYASGMDGGADGQFLEWYEPNGDGTKELGGWTPDLGNAKLFDSVPEAFACWQQERTVIAVEQDFHALGSGRKNRPLTAFSICVLKVTKDEAAGTWITGSIAAFSGKPGTPEDQMLTIVMRNVLLGSGEEA